MRGDHAPGVKRGVIAAKGLGDPGVRQAVKPVAAHACLMKFRRDRETGRHRPVTGVKGAIAGARLSAAEVEREGGRLTQKVIDGAAGRHARMEFGSEGASLVGL